MTKKKLLIFYEEKEKNNIIYFLNNIDYKLYDIDLIIENNININKNIPKKVDIIKYNKSKLKKLIFTIKFVIKNKNKYDLSIIFSSDNLFANNLGRKVSKNNTIFIKLDNVHEYNFRDYFIKRYIYEFNKIIFKTYQDKELFLKHYPTLSKKTVVINDFINSKEIEALSKESINEKIKITDKTILMITELNEEKNKILNMLNLIKELKEDIKNIKLYIIGDGIDKYAYESFIEDNDLQNTIYLLGKKENVYPYIEKCKFIILNSKEELDKYLYSNIILRTQPISKCRYTDDIINIGKNCGYLISIKKKINEEMIEILTNKNKKTKEKFNFENINKERIDKIAKK